MNYHMLIIYNLGFLALRSISRCCQLTLVWMIATQLDSDQMYMFIVNS